MLRRSSLLGALVLASCVWCASCSSYDGVSSGEGAVDAGTGHDGAAEGASPDADAGPPACVAPICAMTGPTCRAYDFEAGCPSDLQLVGDDNVAVKRECTNGKVRIATKDTLDAFATFKLTMPMTPASVRVAARIAVTVWDGGSVLSLAVGATTAFALRAKMDGVGKPVFTFCDAAGVCAGSFTAQGTEEHLFVVEVTTTGITAVLDCARFADVAGVSLPASSVVALTFGKVDGDPIDGTLDDVVVSFF